ncbi:hypothetical protein BJ138DRAFT_1174013 [Hygrophoropsis aurantiaca]|uniref:Uncharacterized protein n=1 Tax=Hygrophoropsis aurantiaca TaxID=72124 RepID=A0ACB8A6V6_9AGAM|nr:hypothetical protein BJ138DRAFT_1174013 [Hygrophoropsis aurantiaca]
MDSSEGQTLRKANPKTIQDKFLVGYQGWFTCAGDGEPVGPGHHGWLHWFNYPVSDGGRPNTDLWPDLSEYSPSELYPAPGLKYANGDPVFLFSSRHPKTVRRHFNWMARHGVDGAFLQRFAGQCDVERGNEGILRIRDEVGDRVKEAAEQEGRVFAIMYDVSGVAPDRIQQVLERDWVHLMREKSILDSPNYLREKDKPVVALWGFGFNDRNHDPSVVRAIVHFFRTVTPGGVYIIAGAPAHWRTSVSDSDRNPEFVDVWLNEFDAICPWTVGRYGNEDDADRFAEEKIKGDVELLKKQVEEGKKKVDYMPVVLPGGSGYNLSQGKWGFNDIKRNGGRFLWRQIYNARKLGIRTIYGAMWDEYDEGTAYMPVVSKKSMLPVHDKYQFMALDEDGYDLPSDWYMRICGLAGETLRNERMLHETFPVKELQDYWSSRPKYETKEDKPSGEDAEKAYREWMATQAPKEVDETPPPPYSLEEEQQQQRQGAPSLPSGGALNSPPVLLPRDSRSRSSTIAGPSTVSQQTSHQTILRGPPPVPEKSRPAEIVMRPPSPPSPSSPPRSSRVSSLADDFSRQRISSPVVRPQSLSPHPQSLSPHPQSVSLHPQSLTPHAPPVRLSSKPTPEGMHAPAMNHRPPAIPGPSGLDQRLPPHMHPQPPGSHMSPPPIATAPGPLLHSPHPIHTQAYGVPGPSNQMPDISAHYGLTHNPGYDPHNHNNYSQPQEWNAWAPPSPPMGYPHHPHSPGPMPAPGSSHYPPSGSISVQGSYHQPPPSPYYGPHGSPPPGPHGGSIPSPPLSHPQYGYSPYQQQGNQAFNGGGGGFVGRARSVMDGVVGQDTRRQLESHVGSVVQTGSKILKKLK